MKKTSIFLVLVSLMMITVISCKKENEDESNDEKIGNFTDTRDGKTYQWVKIGDQIWMAENLAYAPESGRFFAYNFDDNNIPTYGYLYYWDTALLMAPPGWHIPTYAEWHKLIDYLEPYEACKLAGNAALWEEGDLKNNENFNKAGFSGLPAGVYSDYYGEDWFCCIGQTTSWLSVIEQGSTFPDGSPIDINGFGLDKNRVQLGVTINTKGAYSIRCVKD